MFAPTHGSSGPEKVDDILSHNQHGELWETLPAGSGQTWWDEHVSAGTGGVKVFDGDAVSAPYYRGKHKR